MTDYIILAKKYYEAGYILSSWSALILAAASGQLK